jgi:hypothetical protein
MAHENAGHYSAKRGGAKLDERIAASIREKISENRISCAEAHLIAGKLDVDPGEVGTAIDLLEVRIIKCQLGLFGHGGGEGPEYYGHVTRERRCRYRIRDSVFPR